MVFVDINTRILPRDHEIFFARPGSGYRLYPDFIENEMIFIDLPGLNLTPGIPLSQQSGINQQIHRSRALKSWYRGKGDSPKPSVEVGDYSKGIEDAGVSQLRSALTGYFNRAKKGDLVLVAPAAYSFPAFIGEFTEEPTAIVDINVPRFYGEENLQGRRVKWIGKIEKRFLDRTILDIISKPNIFVTLPRSVRREIYDLVYNGYTFDGDFSARFDVTEDDFKTYDDFLIQSFFNFVAANTKAIAEGEGVYHSYRDAAFIDAGLYTPELRTDVSSPGFLNIYSSKITPLVAAVLFALAVNYGPDAFSAAEAGLIRIGNSQAPADDACVADIQAQALAQIKLSGAIGWAEACDKARQAAARTGIKGPAKVAR